MRCAGRDGTKLFSKCRTPFVKSHANLVFSVDACMGECGLYARYLYDRIPDTRLRDLDIELHIMIADTACR
jgi:hypothetical protein